MKNIRLLIFFVIAGTRLAHAIDQNGNGISDVWEAQYPSVLGNLALDQDGDGRTSAQEGVDGTNPLDPRDYFHTTAFVRSMDGSSVTITFRSLQDRYYEIEESPDLSTWTYSNYGFGGFGNSASTTVYANANAPRLFYRVKAYPEYDIYYDYDADRLFSWEEAFLGTDPYVNDSDEDGLPDGWEFANQLNPLSAADAALDLDSDGLSNYWEYQLGLNPRSLDSDANGVPDAQEDRDYDGLTNVSELTTYQTNPAQNDTDGDGLSDGWEILYGYNALVNNETDSDPHNDPDADPDGDGLDNAYEDQIGTNPNNADTDSDGYSDIEEDQAGSNGGNGASTPGNPGGTPGGPTSPPPPTIPVQVNFGDHSGSHSEKYKVFLEPLAGDANTQKRSRTNRKYGETQTETFNLPAGAKYKVTLVHVGTDPQYEGPPKPDYDYTLEFTSGGSDPEIVSIPEDPTGMLGVHDESDAFFASGKDATLYIAWLTSETIATTPTDRKRIKLGVGEEVNLKVEPTASSITWTTTAGTLGTPTSSTRKLTLADATGAATVTVNYLGTTLTKDFTVYAPTGVDKATVASTNSYPVGTQGAGMHLLPVIVGPTDVSFYNVQMLEVGKPASSISGYFTTHTPISHVGHGADAWFTLDYANQWPSNYDYANLFGYPSPWSTGGFTWIIPAKWKVGATGTEHTITGWDQVFEIQANGTTTIRKFGHSVTRTVNDVSTSN